MSSLLASTPRAILPPDDFAVKMARMNLRPYQEAMRDKVVSLSRSGHLRILVQMPTGTGKTLVGVELVRLATAHETKVLLVVPSDEIYRQTHVVLEEHGIMHVDLQAGDWPSLYGAKVVLAMAQTLDRRVQSDLFVGWEPDLVVFDEAHLMLDHHDRIFSAFGGNDVWGVGMSATPCRLDGRPMKDLWPTIVQGPQIRECQTDGWLVPCTTYEAPMPDLTGVGIERGEFDRDDLQTRFAAERIVESVPSAWLRHARRRPTICYAPTVAVSRLLVAAYNAHGIKAMHIDADTADTVRRQAVARLRDGSLDVACNVGVFVHGLDVIEVQCVQLVTATASLARFLQMVGRGLRPAPGKRDLVVIDHGGNCYRHDTIDADRDWSRDGQPLPRTIKACAGCHAVIPAWDDACRRCLAATGASPAIDHDRITTHGVPPRLPPSGCDNPRLWLSYERRRVRFGLPLSWTDRQFAAMQAA